MACALDVLGKGVQLVLLDGPCGPSHLSPPRMGGYASAVAERIRARLREEIVSWSKHSDTTMSHSDQFAAIEGLADMAFLAGKDAALVTASLLEVPDTDNPPVEPLRGSSLYVSAETSANRTNGTLQAVESCLPGVHQVVAAGGHFDFLKKSSVTISSHINNFFHQE